jgi:ABC-type multidrug transport system fused ATPase/permease subunit
VIFTRTAAAMVEIELDMSTPSIYSATQKLRTLLTRKEKMQWVSILFLAFCSALLEILTTMVIVVFAQTLNQPETGQKYLSKLGFGINLSQGRIVSWIAIIVGIIYLAKNLFAAAEVFYQNFSIQKMNYHFKNKLLYQYANVDYGFYLTRNSSLGMAVVGGDADQIFSVGMVSMATILSESIVFLCLVSIIIFMNPSLALTIFGIAAVVCLVITKILLPLFYRWGQRLQEAVIQTHQNLLQFFHAFKEIVLLGKQDSFVRAYQYHSYKKTRIQAIQTATNAIPRMVIEVLFMGFFVTAIFILCLEHESPGQIIGILGGYLYVGFRLMPGLNRIINQLNAFKAIIPSIERIHAEYNTITDKDNYFDIHDFVFEKSITLKNVNFRYLNTDTDALKNVNFTIVKGECIGIIGETGSGKSTLIDVILGLLKPYSGSVLIDGRYPVNSRQWHKKIGYVPQSIYLMDDTIEANIAFGETEVNELKLKASIDAAQLGKLMNQLPKGSKTIIGERGIRLSGGERQRIAIARALYRNPDVLIFDEATSALDNETESNLMQTIHAVSKARTVIMIAHRLTTLEKCNRIIMVEEGSTKEIENLQITKAGNHA